MYVRFTLAYVPNFFTTEAIDVEELAVNNFTNGSGYLSLTGTHHHVYKAHIA